MSRVQYAIGIQPTGDNYESLVRTASQWCSTALLVVRPRLCLSDVAEALIQELDPFLLARRETQSWPGTELLDGLATVLTYRLEPVVILSLTAATSRLYGWQQPHLPEDLCLLRDGGDPSLVTISHEGDGYLVVDESELQSLRRHAPGVVAALHAEAAGPAAG